MAAKTQPLQGALDLLILKALGLSSNRGSGIASRVAQLNRGPFGARPGPLFPEMRRLGERRGSKYEIEKGNGIRGKGTTWRHGRAGTRKQLRPP